MTDIVTDPITFTGQAPVNLTTATFTQGAALALDAASQIINAAWNLGGTTKTDFEAKVTALGDYIDALIAANTLDITASTAGTITVADPNVPVPVDVDSAGVLTAFEAEVTTQVGVLASKVTSFVTEYFPNEDLVYAKAETWLSGALDNPTGGVPVAVQAQLLTEDRDRITLEAARASDAILVKFAASRFPLPPGAAAAATLEIQQNAQDKSAETGRKIVVLSIEQMKFAVEKTLSLRQLALAATMDYVKTLSVGQTLAGQVVPTSYDTQSKFISVAAQYLAAKADTQKIIHSALQFDASQTQDAAAKNQMADLSLIENKVRALMAELAAIAQLTTALYNNVHATAGMTYNVSA